MLRPVAVGPVPWSRPAIAVGTAVVLGALLLYVLTASRDIVFGDTPELTTVALTLGVAHPPGYPVYTLLGWLFGQLPVGPLPFRIALLSVACHAATVGLIYAATYRFTRSIGAAAVAAVALATAPLFWTWSLVGEVFPLNDLLGGTLLLVVALWHEDPRRKGLLVAGAIVSGIGMAHHQTIGLLAPAVLYVLWRRREALLADRGLIGTSALAFAAGPLFYLELLVAAGRRPAWSWSDLQSLGDLVAHVLRLRYGTAALVNEPGLIGGSALARVVALFAALDPLQWLLLGVGTVWALRTRRWYATYLLIAFAVTGPAFAAYSNVNIGVTSDLPRSVLERFFLLPHVAIAPLAGFAVLAVRDLAARVGMRPRSFETAAAVVGVAAALAFVPLSYTQIDRRDDHVARTFAEDLLATVPPYGVLLANTDNAVFPIVYLQQVEGVRRDVALVVLPLFPEPWYVRQLRRANPDLPLASEGYGAGAAPIRAFLDANGSRAMWLEGDLPDTTARGAYWQYTRGLTYEIRTVDRTVSLEQLTADNEATLRTYRPPRYADLVGRSRAWERATLVEYAQAYLRVGAEYEFAADQEKSSPERARQLYEGARSWYRRALEVYPDLLEARAGLARLTGR